MLEGIGIEAFHEAIIGHVVGIARDNLIVTTPRGEEWWIPTPHPGHGFKS